MIALKYVSCLCIVALTAIQIFALFKGIDGQVLSVTTALIAGIAGYELKSLKGA